MTERQVDPLRESRRRDTQVRLRRCFAALERLKSTGQAITIVGVARAAGVGEKFPFRHPELKAAIDEAMLDQGQAVKPSLDAALLAERDHWKADAKRLTSRLETAVRRISELEGMQVTDERGLSLPDPALINEAEVLRARVRELEREVDAQRAEIGAVRRLNRDLVRDNNRLRGL